MIKKKGYAFSDQEVDKDVRAIAAPIFNGRGDLVAGLSITGPVYRMNKKKINSLSRLVLLHSQKISAKLGHSFNTVSKLKNGYNIKARKKRKETP